MKRYLSQSWLLALFIKLTANAAAEIFRRDPSTGDMDTVRDVSDYRCTPSGEEPCCLRLRGSGGDGGSTGAESRSSYLEMYKEKKEDKVDPAQQRHARWTQCGYSGKPLKQPIVADIAGSLFNKEDILEGLSAKALGAQWPENLGHIRLKELVPVSPQASKGYELHTAGDGVGVRPCADAPFECPLTGVPLNGRNRTFLHKPSGLLFTESGAKKVPKIAQELILEACQKILEASGDSNSKSNGNSEKKKSKKGGAAAARAVAEAVVARGGKWEKSEILVVNPEGDDAEEAKALVHCVTVKAKTKSKTGVRIATAEAGVKRTADRPEATVGGQKKKKKTVLESLFHDDGGGAVVTETYGCRSVGARGYLS